MPIAKARQQFSESFFLRSVCVLAALGIFWADSLTPLGFSHGSLYILLIVPLSVFSAERFLIGFAGICVFLTLAGVVFSPPGIDMPYVLSNRLLSVLEISLITAVCILVRRQLLTLQGASIALDESRLIIDQQRSLMEVAASTANVGGWSLSLPERHILWSDYVCKLYGKLPGYRPQIEEAINGFAPEWREQIRRCADTCIAANQPFEQEAELVAATGARTWVRINGRGVCDQHGNIVRVEGSLQDITKDRATQSVLVQLKNRFHQLADAVPQIIWIAEPSGSVDYFNEALLTYTGIRDRAQLQRRGWLTLVHPDDLRAAASGWQRSLLHVNAYSQVFRLRYNDGSYRWNAVQAQPVRDDAGNLIKWCGSAVDVHDTHTLAERNINILENITDGFMTLDSEWRFTYVNREAERVLNCQRENLFGKLAWDLFRDAENFTAHYRRALAEHTSVAFEAHYAALDKWFDVRAFPAEGGLAVYFRDVTGRHLRTEEMRIARERFELLAKATTDAVWDWDLGTDRIWWNDSMFTLFGYHPADLDPGSSSWTSHLHPDDSERVINSIHSTIAGAGQEWQEEYRFCRRDGSYAYVIDKGFILRDADGAAQRMVGGMVDITETKLLQERLAQSQRLEALGQLTGGVAHDFNNLLTVILGNGELLSEQLAQQPEQFQLIDLINQAAERAAQLTRHLLAFARRQALVPQATDTRKLISGMEGMIRRSLMANLEIELVHAAGLWPALVDAAQLESALLNLCLNARDAMPDGGRLTLETGNAYLDETYAAQHDEVQPGQYVVIAVSDTGSGIEPGTLLHVFDPFFTTKDAGKGTGLGLSMVYGFVKQSKGHIKIYTELDQGTTVRMYLPRALQSPIADTPGITPLLRGGNAKVLLVEDDAMVSIYARHLLRDLGFDVLSASNGKDALAIVEQTPDIVLLFTDVIMPGGMNGRQLADSACSLRPDLKVLFTSGYTENAIVHHGRLDPGVHLLSKPYQRKDLVGKLLQVLADHR